VDDDDDMEENADQEKDDSDDKEEKHSDDKEKEDDNDDDGGDEEDKDDYENIPVLSLTPYSTKIGFVLIKNWITMHRDRTRMSRNVPFTLTYRYKFLLPNMPSTSH